MTTGAETGKRGGETGMKIGTIVVVLLLIAGVIYLRGRNSANITPQPQPAAHAPASPGMAVATIDPALEVTSNTAPVESTSSRSHRSSAPSVGPTPAQPQSTASGTTQPPADTPGQRELPHLVDLGAQRCIPCKMMAPILADFQANYSDRFKTTFIDVWQNQAAGEQYGVRVIPTQIFFDPKGRELFRHEGFFSKDDILAKWRELGFQV